MCDNLCTSGSWVKTLCRASVLACAFLYWGCQHQLVTFTLGNPRTRTHIDCTTYHLPGRRDGLHDADLLFMVAVMVIHCYPGFQTGHGSRGGIQVWSGHTGVYSNAEHRPNRQCKQEKQRKLESGHTGLGVSSKSLFPVIVKERVVGVCC